MTLRDYIAAHNLTATAIAIAIGVRPQTVSRYLSGDRFPTRRTIQQIAAATGGAVAPADWYVDAKPRKAA